MRTNVSGCLLSVLLAAAGAIATPAVVEAAAARCEGCTELQMRQRAMAMGEGEHVITSLSTGVIRQYMVVVEPSTGQPVRATPVSVPGDLLEIFAAAEVLYHFSGGTMSTAVEVDAKDLEIRGAANATVYDFFGDANLRGQIASRLTQGNLPGWASLEVPIETMVKFGFQRIGVGDGTIHVTLRFTDGSSVVMKIRQLRPLAEYEPGSARTAAGQVVPEANDRSYAGTWYFDAQTPDSLQPFLNWMHSLGVPVTTGPGGGGGTVTCSWDGSTLACTVQQQ